MFQSSTRTLSTLIVLALSFATTSRSFADSVTVGGVTVFFDGVSDGLDDWTAALDDVGAQVSHETFNDDPVTPGTPGTLNYGLGAGPHPKCACRSC
jgi:hypothetical protein